MNIFISCLLAIFVWAAAFNSASATPYLIDYKDSYIRFSGEHAGNHFDGKFTKWTAKIDFDANKPESGSITIIIQTASAHTGNSMYDGTLPTSDWFNTKQYPTAHFTSTDIKKISESRFKAEGKLTIRGKTTPLSISFTLSPASPHSSAVTTAFTLSIDRIAYGIGKHSDAKAEWVSRDILLSIKVKASPQE